MIYSNTKVDSKQDEIMNFLDSLVVEKLAKLICLYNSALGCVIQSPLIWSEAYLKQNFKRISDLAFILTSEIALQSTASVFFEVF